MQMVAYKMQFNLNIKAKKKSMGLLILHKLDCIPSVCIADRSLFHGKSYIYKYIPGIKASKSSKVQQIHENNLVEVCNKTTSAGWKPRLLPA